MPYPAFHLFALKAICGRTPAPPSLLTLSSLPSTLFLLCSALCCIISNFLRPALCFVWLCLQVRHRPGAVGSPQASCAHTHRRDCRSVCSTGDGAPEPRKREGHTWEGLLPSRRSPLLPREAMFIEVFKSVDSRVNLSGFEIQPTTPRQAI